jgi:uncharacterized protein YwbE
MPSSGNPYVPHKLLVMLTDIQVACEHPHKLLVMLTDIQVACEHPHKLLVMLTDIQVACDDHTSSLILGGFGGLVVSMLASGTRRIFQVKKSTVCLPSEGK